MPEFTTLKSSITIVQACDMLGIKLNKEQRSACPICNEGGPRIFRIFPTTNTFYCWAHKKAGTIIDLTMGVLNCDEPTAGKKLAAHFNIDAPRQPVTSKVNLEEWGKGLNPSHEALQPLGIPPKTFSAFGGGYNALKPSLKGLLCLPYRDRDGTLLGYIGINVETQEPSYPKGLEPSALFNCDRIEKGTLQVVSHPMDVLHQLDTGIPDLKNVVAVLTEQPPYSLDLIERIIAFARERDVDNIEFH